MRPLTTNCYDILKEEIDRGVDPEGRPVNPKGK